MIAKRKQNDTSASPRVRQSNLELFRIILIILIIAHHYVVNSGLMSILQGSDFNHHSVLLLMVSAFGKICINCFVLITGYFMCKSHITLKKFLKFVLEVMFYYGIIYLVFCLFGITNFSIKEFIIRLFPIKIVAADFTSCYIILFLCIPFINIFIHCLNKRQHGAILLLLLFIYTILGNFPWINVSFNYVSWFFVVYLLGAYIRLYPPKHSDNQKTWALASIISIILIFISCILSLAIRQFQSNFPIYYFVVDSNKILAVLSSISFFMFFKNIPMKYNKMINYLAASTFGVLLIHASGHLMTRWLWNTTLNNAGMYGNPLIIIHLPLSVLGVYFVCVFIDKIRIRFIEKPFFHRMTPSIERLERKIKPLFGFSSEQK